MKNATTFLTWLVLAIAMAISGVVYGVIAFPGEPAIIGGIFALLIGVPVLAFERGVFLPRLSQRIQKLPTVPFLVAAVVAYEVIMSIGYAVAALLLQYFGYIRPQRVEHAMVMPLNVFLYALGVCLLLGFILRVRDLLGREIFASMLISRYRKPVMEERVFLFVDLADSTAFAERNGDLRTQEFLSALFAAFAEPVRRHKGAIDDYIGDAAIVTWPLERGVKDSRCIRCIFDIFDVIEDNAEMWLKRFGQVPRLRAALHGGAIITAEIGVDHHKIAYFGDTVNTTARLESMCRSLNRPILISSELAGRMDVPGNVVLEDLGAHALRGRGQPLGVMALTRPPKASNVGQRRKLAG